MLKIKIPSQIYSNKTNEWTSSALRLISSSCILCKKHSYDAPTPQRWPIYNERVFAPQGLEEERRPAYVCHMKTNFKYSPWKLYYIAMLVRGMTVDEAVRQLDYVKRKGSSVVKNTILEAQNLAVEKHGVEFRSNLWVAESFVGKGLVIKGIRRHARKKIGLVEYFHSHYFVRLEEGNPPAQYKIDNLDGPTLLQRWIKERREQRIHISY